MENINHAHEALILMTLVLSMGVMIIGPPLIMVLLEKPRKRRKLS